MYQGNFKLYWWMAVALIVILTLILIAEGGLNLLNVASGALLVGLVGYSGWWVSRRHAALMNDATSHHLAILAELDQVHHQAISILSGQIENARVQTENAIVALTSRFSGIANKLESAVVASQNAAGGLSGNAQDSAMTMLHQSQTELMTVTNTLKSIQKSRDAILIEIQRLMIYIRNMATEVAEIATQSKKLALNITQADVTAKGSDTAAEKVNKLSALFNEAGKLMANKVGVINTTISTISDATMRSAEQDTQSILQCESVIQKVLTGFKDTTSRLSESAEIMQRESAGIRDEVSDVLVSLQFQDRVSQILSHVCVKLNELHENVVRQMHVRDGKSDDIQKWLDKVSESYFTEEQRHVHRKVKGNSTSDQEVSSSDSDVVYFREAVWRKQS